MHDGEFETPGYKSFRRDRGAACGGIAVYVKNEITATRRDDLEDSTVERLWLEISLPKTHGFLVRTFYRPPNSSKYHDKDFMVKLESILDKATSEGKELFTLGDFKCDFLIKRSSIPQCKQLKSLFKSFHIKQVIKEATRVTPDSKTLLDLIAANNPHNISCSGVISCSLSDHEMVYCVRKINWKRAPDLIKTFRNYVKYDPKNYVMN